MGANPDGLLYSTGFYRWGGGVCGLQRCRSATCQYMGKGRQPIFNPLNAELIPICPLLALLGAHHIFHVSGLRVNVAIYDAVSPSYWHILLIKNSNNVDRTRIKAVFAGSWRIIIGQTGRKFNSCGRKYSVLRCFALLCATYGNVTQQLPFA